jgi:Tol biopolymer transport system component
MRRLVPVLILALATAARGQDRTHDVTPDDYFTLATITEVALSADANRVAYCEGRWDKADDARKTDLWVVGTGAAARPARLTSDRANDRHPQWSSGGQSIYFLGNRKREGEKKPPYDGTTQVWVIGLHGGEPRPVTRVEGGVTGYAYAASPPTPFTTPSMRP